MMKSNRSESLSSGLSVYIDFLRVCAALLVMVSHFPLTQALSTLLSKTNFAYDAVVVFFVLSGYVVSYASQVIEQNTRNYFVNRVSRIVPVAVISVIVSSVLFCIVGGANSDIYGEMPAFYQGVMIFLQSIFFANEVWSSHVTPFGNGPYWSLVFEVWCYVFYGVIIYCRGWSRVVLLGVLAATLGPKQIVILPMWLIGAAAYHLRSRIELSKSAAVLLLILPVVCYFLIQIPMPRDWSYAYFGAKIEGAVGFGLDGAGNSGWGYLLALLFGLHLYAAASLLKDFEVVSQTHSARLIKYLASYTFTLYLFHYPLMRFFCVIFGVPHHSHSFMELIGPYTATFACVYVLGRLVEHKKSLYREWVKSLISVFGRIRKSRYNQV